MTTHYRKNERGAREFDVAGRRYSAFWMSLGHYWALREIGLSGLQIAPEGKISWEQKNWREVEEFVAWRHKLETGEELGAVRISE